MPSERIQRQIDAALDEAEAALAGRDWQTVHERASFVLTLDPDNGDAVVLRDAAERGLATTVDGDETGGSRTPAARASSAPSLPDAFVGGRYRVERFIGEGGKKRVFLAHDTTLDRYVAFGQFRTEGMDAAGRARVTQEAQAMGRVGAHPNLVAIYDIGEEAGSPYIVQEYVPGGSLADLIADEPPPLARTLRLAQDVCAALSFIHDQQLVHRDIKPSNVFLTENGSAKVGDFGLAVGLDRTRITMQGGMIGTPSYMPPEQALAGDVTPQSDLYSLGAMLYELVTGRPPFVGDDPTSVISQHINTPPVAPSWHSEQCPPDLEELILSCLAKSPDHRPASAAAVSEALARVDPEAKSATHSGSGANPLDRLAQGVFVGRESELERLRGAFDDAFAGRGSVVMLVGEPGIGKTRTSQELATYARMRGAHVLWGRTHESEGMPAYWPWKQVGDANARLTPPAELAGALDTTQVAELSRIFPVLRQAVNAPEPEPISDAAAGQFRVFDAYTAFMRAACEVAPLLIILDDLHWADKPSLQLLQYFARELGNMRVLVAGNYRDTELARTHPLSEALAELNREGGFLRLPLRGLTRDEVERYIRASSGLVPSRGVADRIFEETEGNPFFLSEVVNLMTEEGTLNAGSVSDVAIPDGVREALGRRLDRLSDDANQLLTIAAVVGREFPYETLSLLHEGSEGELVALVEEGLRARVIEELDTPGRYRFTHAQMQETLLAELSTTRRVHLNGQIAEALERRYGDRAEERAPRLAQHFFEASTLTDRHAEKALHYSRLAAQQAEAQAAWAEGARHYESCISVMDTTGEEFGVDRADLLMHLGECHASTANLRGGFRSYMQAIDIFRARGDWTGQASATVSATRFPLDRPRALALTTAALEASGERDPYQEARLLTTRANWQLPADEEGFDADRGAARALIEENGFEDLQLDLMRLQARELQHRGEYAEASDVLYEMYQRQRTAGELPAAGASLTFSMNALAGSGQFDRILERARESREFERTVGHDRLNLETAEEWICHHLILRGEVAEAREVFEGMSNATFAPDVVRCDLAHHEGQIVPEDQLPDPRLAGVVAGWRTLVHAARATAFFEAGRPDRALRELEELPEIPGPFSVRFNAVGLARDAIVQLGSDDLVRQAYEATLRGDQPLGAFRNRDLTAGALAVRLGLLDEAEAHLRTALDWCVTERAPFEEGRTHQWLARLAHARGDESEALGELDQAQRLFQQGNAVFDLQSALALRLELQGGAGSDSQTSLVALTTSVKADRPDVASAVAPDGTVTLLFSDIEDSTAMNVELGDDAWMRLLGEHNRLVRDAIREHRGFEVKTEGDAFMVAFGSARDAVRCAQAMQRALEARSEEPRLRIRIGLHTGEPVREADDFYGTHVVLASRICSQAGGGEILVSSLLRDLVAASGEFALTSKASIALKGLDGEHLTYAVGWA